VLFSPVFAKLRHRLDPQTTLTRTTPVAAAFVQPLSFPSLTRSFPRRRARILFNFKQFRTLFTVTAGVPPSFSFWILNAPLPGSPTSALNPLTATLTRNHPLSPAIATDPKTPSRKSFPCHTSETSGGLSASRISALLFVDFPFLHDKLHVFQHADVFHRIPRNRDNVRVFPGLERSEQIRLAQ